MTTAGEEQGLVGARVHAARAKESAVPIQAVFNNDIVGGITDSRGISDASVRIYSGGPVDSPSRALADFARRIAARYVPWHRVRLLARDDRFGRSGDHVAFGSAGFAAIGFRESRENFDKQHNPRDTIDGVSFPYLAQNVQVNAAAVASLALAPPPPVTGAVRTSAIGSDGGPVEAVSGCRWLPGVLARSVGPRLAARPVCWQRHRARGPSRGHRRPCLRSRRRRARRTREHDQRFSVANDQDFSAIPSGLPACSVASSWAAGEASARRLSGRGWSMVACVLRVSLVVFLVGSASAAWGGCLHRDRRVARHLCASGPRGGNPPGHHAVRNGGRARGTQRLPELVHALPRSARQPRRRHHLGSGKNLAVDRADAGRFTSIHNQMVRSIVTGRPMTGLSVVDRTNVTSLQAQERRVHSDSLCCGRLGYGGVFADRIYGTPSLGFGYRAELDSFAIDLAFLNHQFSSPGSYSSPRASAFSVLESSALRFQNPESNRSVDYGGGLSYGFRSISRGSYSYPSYSPGSYTTSWSGSGLQGELTVGYEIARATSLRVFAQADAVLPFYQLTSESPLDERTHHDRSSTRSVARAVNSCWPLTSGGRVPAALTPSACDPRLEAVPA